MRTEAARNNAEWCDIVCRLHGVGFRAQFEAEWLYRAAVRPPVAGCRVPAWRLARAWRCCLATVARHFPGLPAVGYEHGPTLAAALRQGFQPIGALRVWLAGG